MKLPLTRIKTHVQAAMAATLLAHAIQPGDGALHEVVDDRLGAVGGDLGFAAPPRILAGVAPPGAEGQEGHWISGRLCHQGQHVVGALAFSRMLVQHIGQEPGGSHHQRRHATMGPSWQPHPAPRDAPPLPGH